MRILAVTNMYPTPAFPTQGVFVREQINGLRAVGVEVRVVFVDRRRAGPRVYFNGLGKAVRNAVAEFDPSVIHVLYGGVMANEVLRRCPQRPGVVTFHGSDLLGENLSGWPRKIISRYGVHCSRRAARRARTVVIVAGHLRRALNGAVGTKKIRVIPCGIDLERFKPMDGLDCKHKLGWNPSAFHVLFASGNGDPVKRPWLAAAAVDRMNPAGRPAQLQVLAAVPNTEVPVWLNAGDALLLTSLHEGSPTIVKEALACGLPVVSVDVGDVAERIAGVEGCHLARPEPEDLADKLEKVRRRGQRLNCRDRLAELSVLSVAQKLKRCYEEIL